MIFTFWALRKNKLGEYVAFPYVQIFNGLVAIHSISKPIDKDHPQQI